MNEPTTEPSNPTPITNRARFQRRLSKIISRSLRQAARFSSPDDVERHLNIAAMAHKLRQDLLQLGGDPMTSFMDE